MTGIDPIEGRPKMKVWFNRARAEMEPIFTENHKFIYEIVNMEKSLFQEE